MTVYNHTKCELGEGPLWHPLRRELFWFDIHNKTLHTDAKSWTFDEIVSAAGWIDENTLVIASETAFKTFDITSGTSQHLHDLEADIPDTRSNDGRIDPWGGFWIGTMGKEAEDGAGAIYRYYQGQLRKIVTSVTISNSICFAADRSHAYYSDTKTSKIMRIPLDRTGWPDGAATEFIDFTREGLNPDGAVIDAQGNLWVAQWGASRVASYAPTGTFTSAVPLPALHTTCPAFGGADCSTLYVTSATQGLSADTLTPNSDHGKTFAVTQAAKGLPEPRVLL